MKYKVKKSSGVIGQEAATRFIRSVESSPYHYDLSEAIDDEIKRAHTELRKRKTPGSYRGGKYSKSAITSHSTGNKYPHLDYQSLNAYINTLKSKADYIEDDIGLNMGNAVKIHENRSAISRTLDGKRDARIRTFDTWKRAPGRYDFPGVDTKGSYPPEPI